MFLQHIMFRLKIEAKQVTSQVKLYNVVWNLGLDQVQIKQIPVIASSYLTLTWMFTIRTGEHP